MILHYAHLCAAAGGVDAFLIGSELRGLTTIRDGVTIYPVVTAMKQLASDVAGVLGASTAISYAADWSEYFGHQPTDGFGDLFYHLDPLWADPNIDFIGIDNYLPLSDWRDGFDHADAQAGWNSIHDLDYLRSNIEGSEGFEWFYASEADRAAQIRTPITDGAYNKPWVFRPKDMRAWWSNPHYNRPGGIESTVSTSWIPQSKPVRFTELGCPAVDRGTNQPNVFYDPKSAEAESALPHFSRGWQDEVLCPISRAAGRTRRSSGAISRRCWDIGAIRTDAAIYDLPPGQYRPASLPGATVYGPAEIALMDLPQITDTVPAHRPYAAVFAKPWYGTAAVWRSADTSGFALLDIIGQTAQIGALVADLPSGPLNRFDHGNELLVDVSSGTLTSVTDTELFAGANALAVESAPDIWEVIQFGNAELVSIGRYRLTRLLRGQRGTGDAMGNPAPTGTRVVVLGSGIQPLSIAEADLGLPWNWRIGPASATASDAIMQARNFTPNGRGLMPFAPAQLRMRREANVDLALRWLRCDRALSADSWVLTDVPMSEASETYNLKILNGAVVVRSLSGLSSPTFTYTAAMQSTDFGGPVTSLSVRLYQIGALGRGMPHLKTLTLKESL